MLRKQQLEQHGNLPDEASADAICRTVVVLGARSGTTKPAVRYKRSDNASALWTTRHLLGTLLAKGGWLAVARSK
jgi:hypothetical protein